MQRFRLCCNDLFLKTLDVPLSPDWLCLDRQSGWLLLIVGGLLSAQRPERSLSVGQVLMRVNSTTQNTSTRGHWSSLVLLHLLQILYTELCEMILPLNLLSQDRYGSYWWNGPDGRKARAPSSSPRDAFTGVTQYFSWCIFIKETVKRGIYSFSLFWSLFSKKCVHSIDSRFQMFLFYCHVNRKVQFISTNNLRKTDYFAFSV